MSSIRGNIIFNRDFSAKQWNPQTNNTITTQFPQSQTFRGCEIALSSITLNYCWYNITAAYGNNTVSYSWPNSSGYTAYSITIPDGSYDIPTLNAYIQNVMTANGTYFLQGVTPIFFLSIAVNTPFYRAVITSTEVPTSVPSGYTLPSNYPGGSGNLPASASYPYFTVTSPTNPGVSTFGVVIGFSPVVSGTAGSGIYPPVTTGTPPSGGVPWSVNGQYPPEVETVNAVFLLCDVVNVGLISTVPNILAMLAPTVPFGNSITVTPPQRDWYRLLDGTYQSITLQLADQDGNPLIMQDPVWTATVVVRQL